MNAAYIDTSLLIAMKFQGLPAAAIEKVKEYDLFSSELLIAETLAFGKRESLSEHLVLEALKGVSWIIPDGTLIESLIRITRLGYARGADLWHLACACYLSPNPTDLVFLTMDEQQRNLASLLGFQVPAF